MAHWQTGVEGTEAKRSAAQWCWVSQVLRGERVVWGQSEESVEVGQALTGWSVDSDRGYMGYMGYMGYPKRIG